MSHALTEDVDQDVDDEMQEEDAAMQAAFFEAMDEATKKRKREETELDEEFTHLQQEMALKGYEGALTAGADAGEASHNRLLELQVRPFGSLHGMEPCASCIVNDAMVCERISPK